MIYFKRISADIPHVLDRLTAPHGVKNKNTKQHGRTQGERLFGMEPEITNVSVMKNRPVFIATIL